jgi:hypothetical protein
MRGEEVHRDAAAHRAGADHAHLLDAAGLGAFGKAVDLGGLALGEEEILLGLRLRAAHQLHEQLALPEDALGIGLGDGRLDRLDVLLRRLEAAELARILLAELLEERRIVARLLELVVALAGLRDGAAVLDLVGEGDGVRLELAFDQPVDEADGVRLLRGNGIAGRRHLQSLADPRGARQALGAARAGQEAELHFGHAELRRRHRNPVVGGERHFEAAAEGGAVDRSDHRLGAVLDHVDDLRKHRRLERLGRAELADVGAGEEGLAVAQDDDRLHRLVRIGFLDRPHQPFAHRMAERVHRRVVRGDDEDVTVAAGADRAHAQCLPGFRRCDRRSFT